jgi:hypothetical protein
MELPVLPEIAARYLTLDEVVTRLSASSMVDGLALFGSRPTSSANPVSDYDLLILVHDQPAPIFQLFTMIDHRLADVVFVETSLAGQVLAARAPVAAGSFESMFLCKMVHAEIVYDPSGRLQQVQQWVTTQAQRTWLQPSGYAAGYGAWFWQNHALAHLQRIVGSDDPAHQTEFDLMLGACLADLGHAYCTLRDLPWEGYKTAVRTWMAHDPAWLGGLRGCLAAPDRAQKLALYRTLVAQVLAPVGGPWPAGVTAVWLRDPAQHETQAAVALDFWESLLAG